jgi:DNA-binding NarL/FixJ family response regulator
MFPVARVSQFLLNYRTDRNLGQAREFHMSHVYSQARVLLVDDHVGMLQMVSKLLRAHFEIVARVSNGAMAIEAAILLKPDLIVMDIAMPERDGLQTAHDLKRIECPARIVFLTVNEDEDYVSAALACGALGYVLKSRMHTDLIHAMESAQLGRVFVSHHAVHTT